ncbi:MAG: hypothetical protein J2P34_12255 [Actinobacteria bacterium]|nr:hypothetical protein [Actinomycetota bacterium]
MQIKSRQLRWAVPAAGVAAVAAVAAASLVTRASAAPQLPPTTPGRLLAAVAGPAAPLPPLTGTVVETASLGLPQLPGVDNQNSITSLVTGSHTVKVWYGGPRQVRLSVPVPMGETDVIRNGPVAYLWQSSSNTVSEFRLPAGQPRREAVPVPKASPITPQQAAQRVLAVAGRSTRVSVQSNVSVAGQAAYQLVLVPKDSRSLVGRVSIALDGQHPQVPLRVQVFARGARSPAFQVGYTSISFVRPAAANFRFTPPSGARVRTVTPRTHGGMNGAAPQSPFGPNGGQVMGKDWLSVAVLPSSVLSGLTGSGNAASVAGQAAQSASGGGGSGPSAPAVAAALLKSATPVRGSWGSGKLLRTSLISVLITGNGHVLAGPVTPAVLYADAAHLK